MATKSQTSGRAAILLHPDDNVITVLSDAAKGETASAGSGEQHVDVCLIEAVRFGHKIAIKALAEGEEVIKYGMPIGAALTTIEPGAWVHVHNCRSVRYGFRQEKYGIRA